MHGIFGAISGLFGDKSGQTVEAATPPEMTFQEIQMLGESYLAPGKVSLKRDYNFAKDSSGMAKPTYVPEVVLDIFDITAQRDGNFWTMKIVTYGDMTMTYKSSEATFGGGSLSSWDIEDHAPAFKHLGFTLVKEGEGLVAEYWLEKTGLTTPDMFAHAIQIDAVMRNQFKSANMKLMDILQRDDVVDFSEGHRLYQEYLERKAAQDANASYGEFEEVPLLPAPRG